MRTVTVVVLSAVPVNDGVVSSDGDGGAFSVTLGAAASAVRITGNSIDPAATRSRTTSRRTATLTSRRALDALITLPPSMFQSAGEPRRRPRNWAIKAITYKSLAPQFRRAGGCVAAFLPHFAEISERRAERQPCPRRRTRRPAHERTHRHNRRLSVLGLWGRCRLRLTRCHRGAAEGASWSAWRTALMIVIVAAGGGGLRVVRRDAGGRLDGARACERPAARRDDRAHPGVRSRRSTAADRAATAGA